MSVTRRTLQELVVRYELHPDVCDIYVEGESDKDLLRWFFESSGRRNVVVYPITEVEIPVSILQQRNLANNNRGRVILLAVFLEESLDPSPQVICVIDADLDYALQTPPPPGLLVRTDFSSLDMYAFDESAVHKTARLLGCELEKSGKEILEDITPFLQRLFLHRLVSQVLQLELQWVDAHKCCSIESSGVVFDEVEFQRRYLNKKGLTEQHREAFSVELRKYESRHVSDVRVAIRGHDFTEALAWYLGKHISRPPHPDPKLIRRLLFASIPLDQLAANDFFTTLLERTAACG